MVYYYLSLRRRKMKDKITLKSIETVQKFDRINVYTYHFFVNDKPLDYNLVSRRKMNKKNSTERHIDATVIFPYFKKGKDIFVVFIKQFRFPINDYIYDLPAGRTEAGEDAVECAKREVMEEIGGRVIHITPAATPAYTSPGMTNEYIATYFAEVELVGTQALEDYELIDLEIVNLKDIQKFVDTHTMGMTGKMLSKMFYYQCMLNKKVK